MDKKVGIVADINGLVRLVDRDHFEAQNICIFEVLALM